jgi:hypothetical protein
VEGATAPAWMVPSLCRRRPFQQTASLPAPTLLGMSIATTASYPDGTLVGMHNSSLGRRLDLALLALQLAPNGRRPTRPVDFLDHANDTYM